MGQIRCQIFRGGEAKKFPGSTWPPLNIFSGYAPAVAVDALILSRYLPARDQTRHNHISAY